MLIKIAAKEQMMIRIVRMRTDTEVIVPGVSTSSLSSPHCVWLQVMTGMPGWSWATTATIRGQQFSQFSRSQIVTPATDHKKNIIRGATDYAIMYDIYMFMSIFVFIEVCLWTD